MTNQPDRIDRAAFLKRAGGLLAVAFMGRTIPATVVLAARPSDLVHPDPRPGITAEHVLTAEQIGTPRKEKAVAAAYDAARQYPELFDGLACACGCTGKDGHHRSLLVCYETTQPAGCGGCQEEAKLVARLAKDEKTLAEIRATIDKKWG